MNAPTYESGLFKSKKVWFEDGTLVIQAGCTLFRVYQGILQRDSPVFNALFSLPRPDNAASYEGAPLIELKDDADGLELFLDVLHQWRQLSVTKLTFRESLVVAEFAAKYCIHDLQRRAIGPVKAVYSPTSLEDWTADQVQFRGDRNATNGLFVVESLDRNQLNAFDHINIINLARKLDLPEVLPAAFYAAGTSLSVDNIFDGVVVPDAKNAKGEPSSSCSDSLPRVYQFEDPRDSRICVEGQRRLSTVFHPFLHLSRSLMIQVDKCSARHRPIGMFGPTAMPGAPMFGELCVQLLNNQMSQATQKIMDEHLRKDACSTNTVMDFRALDDFVRRILHTCPQCKMVLTSACQSYRQLIWANLSIIFPLQ